MFKVRVSSRKEATVCELAGDLDAFTVSRFRGVFSRCLGRPAVVIDLSKVQFIDGAGLTALVGAVRRAREKPCQVAVACARSSLRNALATAAFDQIVLLVGTTEDALAAVSQSRPRATGTTPKVA
jgi:anti-anti-sigma factor